MRRVILATVLSCSAASTGAGSNDHGSIVFTITSSAPGTAFLAVCTLVRHGVEKVEDHSGTAPATLRFDADNVRCELSSKGPLTVLAEGPRGNSTRSSTPPGGRISISL